IKDAIRQIRNARAEHHVDPGSYIAANIYPGANRDAFNATEQEIQWLARIDSSRYTLQDGEPTAPDEPGISIVTGGASIFLPLAGLVDIEAERERINREIDDARAEAGRAQEMLNNEQFVSKAPEHVVQQQRDRLERANEQVALLERRLQELDGS
ncbi:MAG: valine--tRNA ligase, partial [Chloroflexota bacterium]